MIKKEIIKIGHRSFVKTFSDTGYYIRKTNSDFLYNYAIDVPFSGFKYVETDTKIPEEKENIVETSNNE